jgi:hypothetical protein
MLFSFSKTAQAPCAATVTALSAYLTAFDIRKFSWGFGLRPSLSGMLAAGLQDAKLDRLRSPQETVATNTQLLPKTFSSLQHSDGSGKQKPKCAER